MNTEEVSSFKEMGFEDEVSFEEVHQYNAFTILTKLKFPIEEATKIESESVKLLDDLAKQNLSNEEIITLLLEYRKKIVNS